MTKLRSPAAFAVLAVLGLGACASLPEPRPQAAVSAGLPPSVTSCLAFVRAEFRRAKHSGAVRRVGEDTLCFGGAITPESGEAFVAALSEIPAGRPVHVVVRSPGGHVGAGLDMAEALLPRDVTLVVSGQCNSSCANYLFLPADRRVVLRHSLVMFHGGMNQEHLERVRAELVAYEKQPDADPAVVSRRRENLARVPSYIERQTAMLRAAGVDPDFFFWSGVPLRFPSGQCTGRPPMKGLVFSDAFLAAHGAAVHVSQGVQSPKDLPLLFRRAGSGICFWTDPGRSYLAPEPPAN